MARRVCQALLALALLYVGAVAAFAWLHYRSGERPDAVTVAGDLHRWVGGLFSRRSEPPSEPGSLPAPRDPSDLGGDPDLPPPWIKPSIPAGTAPAPGSGPGAALGAAPGAPTADARTSAIQRVRDTLLPEAERRVRLIRSATTDREERKSDAKVVLNKARDLLGPILDADSHDRDAQDLNHRVMELMIAVDKS